jgi:hypothetical protein
MTITTPKPERVEILNEAAGLIVGQRQQDYGTPEENFQRMADYANIHFKKNLENNIPISARQTAEYMILLKMARTINSPTRDSYVDIGGYAGIAGELAKNEKYKTAINSAVIHTSAGDIANIGGILKVQG